MAGEGITQTITDDAHHYTTDDARILLERFTEQRDGTIRAEVTCSSSIMDAGEIAGPVRLNLLSDRSIKALANTLESRVAYDWYALLSYACAESVRAHREGRPLEPVELGADHRRKWILDPFLEESGYTVLFARGGSGKSFIAAAIALSIATGTPIFGQTPSKTGPVAYLDWEATKETFEDRVSRLARPLDLHRPQVWYRHETASLYSTAPQLRRMFIKHGVVACVVDSKGMAMSGSPEDTEALLELTRAIRRLEVPVLLIDHISKGAIKGDDPDMAFGSVYTEYQARLAWSVKSEFRPGELKIRLKNTKANNGPRRPEQAVDLIFDEDRVRVVANGALAVPREAERLPDPFV